MCGEVKPEAVEQADKGEVTRQIKQEMVAGLITARAVIAKPNVMVKLEDKTAPGQPIEAYGFAKWSSEDQRVVEQGKGLIGEGMALLSEGVDIVPPATSLDLIYKLEQAALVVAKHNWDPNKGIALALDRAILRLRDLRLGTIEVTVGQRPVRWL